MIPITLPLQDFGYLLNVHYNNHFNTNFQTEIKHYIDKNQTNHDVTREMACDYEQASI